MIRPGEYDRAMIGAPECIHGVVGGDLVRPWCDTPQCALCRTRHHVHWRRLPDVAPESVR